MDSVARSTISMAVDRGTPARSRFRTAVRRKSWAIRLETPAYRHARWTEVAGANLGRTGLTPYRLLTGQIPYSWVLRIASFAVPKNSRARTASVPNASLAVLVQKVHA
jgi:hypothetical protein